VNAYSHLAIGIGLVAVGALVTTPPIVHAAATTRVVYFHAVDAKGDFVTDLTAADISVKEAGQPRDVTELALATEPCHVAVIVDDGGNGLMQMPVAELINAAGRAEFSISMLNPQSIRLNDYTSNVDLLERSIGSLVQRGRLERDSQILADAIAWTARDMLKRKLSRPVIVTLTNGGDSAEREVAKDVLSELYASGASLHLAHVVAVPLGEVFIDGPVQSGGSSTVVSSTGGFAQAMTAIARTLAHQYKLTYVLPTGVKPGERLQVTTTRPRVRIVGPTRISSKVQ
jgi:hypothetical protein